MFTDRAYDSISDGTRKFFPIFRDIDFLNFYIGLVSDLKLDHANGD